jgi:hypothetical protein
MPRDDLALYLTLSPEFGGTRFGPFEALEVRLGADRERCHIVLPEAFGVAREHCKVIRQGEGLILAASERTAAVFVWKGDARRPTQIQAPTSVRPGDSFALVSPEGARFTVVLAPLPAEVLAAREKQKRKSKLSAEGFAQEGWRLLLARIWSLGPFGLLMRGWYLITSGSILQPRILIPLVIAAVGYLGMAGSSCAALKFKADQKTAEDKLADCTQVRDAGGGPVTMKSTPVELIAAIEGSTELKVSLADDNLRGLVLGNVKAILASPDDYEWLYRGKGEAVDSWIKLRKGIDETDDFDKLTKVLLPYTAAVGKRTSEGWNVWKDTGDARTCLRGPARLSFRQAKSLGFENVQLDGYHGEDTLSFTNDDTGRLTLLQATATAAGLPFPDPPPATEEGVITAGREFCVFASGDDDRDQLSKVVKVFKKQFGIGAAGVPDASNSQAALGRILKFYSADLPGNTYADGTPRIDFTNSVSQPLKEQIGAQQVYARVAEVIARSVALPCLAALENEAVVPDTFGRPVEPLNCLALKWKLDHQQ